MSLAPQSIRIRYGPSGLLGSAVAAASASQRDERQADRDQAFIGQMLDYKRSQERDVDAINANQLQQAYARSGPQAPQTPVRSGIDQGSDSALKAAYLAGASPDLGGQSSGLQPLLGNRNVSPDEFRQVLASNVNNSRFRAKTAKEDEAKQQKLAYLKSASAGIGEEDAAALEAAAESPDMSVAQLRYAVAAAQKKTQSEQGQSKEAVNKKAFVSQIAKNLTGPGHADALVAMAEDSKTTMSQLRSAYGELASREHAEVKNQKMLQAQGIDQEAHMVATQMARLAGELRAAGVDPDVMKPADFNPTYADPNAATFNTMGFGASIKDNAMVPGTGNLVTPNPNAAQFKTYAAYQQMKSHLVRLLQARKGLVSDQAPAGGADAAADPLGIR